MIEEQCHDRIFGRVVVSIEIELGEVVVLADHVDHRVDELCNDRTEGRLIERLLQVLDDGEIDVAFFEKGDRPSSLASIVVVVEREHPGSVSAQGDGGATPSRREGRPKTSRSSGSNSSIGRLSKCGSKQFWS